MSAAERGRRAGEGRESRRFPTTLENPVATVLIASANRLFAECLVERLAREKSFRVVGTIESPSVIRGRRKETAADILVFDTDALGGVPENLVEHLQSHSPSMRTIVLIPRANEHFVARLLQSGAAGVLPRGETFATFLRALEVVASGNTWADRQSIGFALTEVQRTVRRTRSSLTPREEQLLGLLGDGYRNKEMASLLHIKEHTVKVHLHSLFRKLNVRTRVEAALKAADLS